MTSWGQNRHSYHPDYWELEYTSYRYLSGMNDNELQDRYCAIVKNMRSYTDRAREVIPLNTYQSAWYWYRKEHQTRLEFALRNSKPLVFRHERPPMNESGPLHPDVPNGSKLILRYGKREYMQHMVDQGRIRISPAHAYENETNNAARRDNELHKHSYIPGRYTSIVHESGKKLH